MENIDTTTGKSLTLVLWHKLVDFIAEYTIVQIIGFLSLAFFAGCISALVVNLNATSAALLQVVRWNNFSIIKILAVYLIVFNARTIFSMCRNWAFSVVELFADQKICETLDGVPVSEILDHLFTEKTFKRDDIESKFSLPRYKVTELTKNLKRVSVLIHGENNASILNPNYSRQDIASILRGHELSAELEPLFRKKADMHYTSDPTAMEIEERVNTILSPAYGFKTRKIKEMAETSHATICAGDMQPACATFA